MTFLKPPARAWGSMFYSQGAPIVFNGTAASETLKECFGRFSNLTLSADAFAKRADCAVTNGVEDTEKASGYLQEFYAHARMAEGGMLSFFRADGKTLKNAEDVSRIKFCFANVTEAVNATIKTADQEQFTRSVMCVVGSRGRNVPQYNEFLNLDRAETLDRQKYAGSAQQFSHRQTFNDVSNAIKLLAVQRLCSIWKRRSNCSVKSRVKR